MTLSLMTFLLLYYNSLRKKCTYSESFWSVFSRIRTEYGEMQSISPYLVQIRENTDQNNSQYGHFSRSDCCSSQISNFGWLLEKLYEFNMLWGLKVNNLRDFKNCRALKKARKVKKESCIIISVSSLLKINKNTR